MSAIGWIIIGIGIAAIIVTFDYVGQIQEERFAERLKKIQDENKAIRELSQRGKGRRL